MFTVLVAGEMMCNVFAVLLGLYLPSSFAVLPTLRHPGVGGWLFTVLVAGEMMCNVFAVLLGLYLYHLPVPSFLPYLTLV